MKDRPNDQQAVATYIADLCAELVGMAEGAKLRMLAYLLDMVRIEAETTARSGSPPAGRRDDDLPLDRHD